ncbi:uncharacterized protein V6R79_007059, partial [Siganus canaliculatus]
MHFENNSCAAAAAAAARVHQINATPAKIDWGGNRKDESVLKILSKAKATSAESCLGLICRCA